MPGMAHMLVAVLHASHCPVCWSFILPVYRSLSLCAGQGLIFCISKTNLKEGRKKDARQKGQWTERASGDGRSEGVRTTEEGGPGSVLRDGGSGVRPEGPEHHSDGIILQTFPRYEHRER